MANLKAALLGSILGDVIMNEGRVTSVRPLGPFRHVEVQVDSRRALAAPGDKIQVFMPDVGARTYTPFAMEPASRTFQLLALAQHASPGGVWARGLSAAAPIRFVGPSGSLNLSRLRAPIALFGDETSVAVARALHDLHGVGAQVVLEVDDMGALREVVQALGLGKATLIQRTHDNSHLTNAAASLGALAGNGDIALTGRARSIQRMRQELRAQGSRASLHAKAYWADGKRGLD